MKQPTFAVINTYRTRQSAIDAAIAKNLNPKEVVFNCENGMNGFEIRIYDDWQQYQPDIYIKK